MDTSQGVVVRLLRDGEEAECNDLHNRHFGRRRTLAQWRWEFTPPGFPGRPLPLAVVVDQGRIVGTQALIPVRLCDRDGVFWTAKSEGTLLEPPYRGRGLSVKMYRLLFDYAEEQGMSFVWGFTTATKALAPSGFTVPAVTSQLFFPYSVRAVPLILSHDLVHKPGGRLGPDAPRALPRPSRARRMAAHLGCAVAQSMSGLRFASGETWRRPRGHHAEVELRTLSAPPADSEILCRNFVSRWGGATIHRDDAYVDWRVFSNPWVRPILRGVYLQGRLQGWVACALGDDGMGYLVDVLAAPDAQAPLPPEPLVRLLLGDAVRLTRKMGAVGLRAWSVNGHAFDRLVTRTARRMGFYRLRRGMSMVLYATSHGTRRRAVGRGEDWYVTRLWTEGTTG